MENAYWDVETEAPIELTIKELNRLCTEFREIKEKKAELEKEISSLNAQNGGIQNKILETLEEFGMKNFTGDFGTVSQKKNYSVKHPKDPFQKTAFFNYLKEDGVFEEMVTVNSRTFTSWVKKEIEAKEEEGLFGWCPPGVDAPEIIKTISLRKS